MEQNDGTASAVATDERVNPATPQQQPTNTALPPLTLADLVTTGEDFVDIPIKPKGKRAASDDRKAILRFRAMDRDETRKWKLLQYGTARAKAKPREARRLLCSHAVAILGVDMTAALAPYEGDLAKWLEFDEIGGLLAEWTLDVFVSRCVAKVESDDADEDE